MYCTYYVRTNREGRGLAYWLYLIKEQGGGGQKLSLLRERIMCTAPYDKIARWGVGVLKTFLGYFSKKSQKYQTLQL